MRTDYVLSIEPFGNTHAVFLCIPGAVFVLFEAYAAMPAKDQWQACENVRGYIARAAKSLAPTPGTEGGDGSPVVDSTEPTAGEEAGATSPAKASPWRPAVDHDDHPRARAHDGGGKPPVDEDA
jgi:hypothetical protein